ncbi:MAG: FMN-binding protein [Victivallales bacterium]
MKIKTPIIIILFSISVCIFISAAEQKAKVQSFRIHEVEKAVGGTVKTQFRDKPVPHIEVAAGETKAYLFNTGDLKVSRQGFNKKAVVDVFVLIDARGKVINASIGENADVPGYVRMVVESSIFSNWHGKEAGDKAPDAVTKATFTSKAVNGGVEALLKKLREIGFFSNLK